MAMTPGQRLTIAALSLSAAGFVGIVAREGYTDDAIIPTKGDVPTMGFGTTEGVKMGDRTNPVRAVKRALTDSQKYEGALKRCVTAPLHQVEYDVYVQLAYNIGATNFCVNPKTGGPAVIPRRLNAGDYVGACNGILEYKYAAGYDCSTPGNTRCAGVWTDRLNAHAACMAAQ